MTNMTTTLYERQIELENEGIQAGIARYRRLIQESREYGNETRMGAGARLLKAAIEPTSRRIEEWVSDKTGTPRRKHTAVKYLRLLEPETVAFITAKAVLDSVSQNHTLNNTAIRIGSFVEDELRLRRFQDENTAFYSTVSERVQKKSNHYGYKRTVLNHAMQKGGIDWEPWGQREKLHVGQKCLELFIEATGLVTVSNKPHTGGNIYYVTATEETMRWINEENARCELLSPVFMPMVVPPKDWVSPFEGGYLSHQVQKNSKLLKSRSWAYMEELSNTDMPVVYKALNTAQKTPWRINSNILSTVKGIWDTKLDLGGLPPRTDLDIPPSPIPDGKKVLSDIEKELLSNWKKAAARVYDLNHRNRSKRIQAAKIIYLAEKFQEYDSIYFPYNLDFRGRVYAIPMFLNPQGCDLARGLLEFSEGKPIENSTAGDWLAIHGANMFGYDKVGYTDRVEWVIENHDAILASAHDPLANHFWSEADDPWQFLAFCYEWKGFYEEGLGFVSRLPVHLDGSCNGLQHFSAMLRDPVGGEAVNLMPSDLPQDIYQRVSDVVIGKLEDIISSQSATDEEITMARQWLELGVDRKLAKRPVMVLPYGGTPHSCRQYVEDRVYEIIESSESQYSVHNLPFDGKMFLATKFMANILWESIGEVVVAAREVMDWLREVARIAASENLPIVWTAPNGFPVQQWYKQFKSNRVLTKLLGKTTYLTVKEASNRIDKRRQANGIAPNFVHSLDAACLHMYVVQASEKYGLTSFALIHDSYGTHAADTEASSQCLREVFVQMYQDNNVLKNLREELKLILSDNNINKLPPVPRMGGLDIACVRDSKFFFS